MTAPHFELQRVYADERKDPPEIVPVLSLPWDTRAERRGFLGMGLVAGAVVGLGGCRKHDAGPPLIPLAPPSTPEPESSCSNTGLTHTGEVTDVVSSHDGKWIASAAYDEAIKLWDARSGKLFAAMHGQKQRVALAFSPDGQWLASASSMGVLRLWAIPSGALYQSWEDRGGLCVAFSPNGRLLASATDTTVKVHEMPSGELATSLEGHPGSVIALAFNADGSRLASGAKGVVKVWEMPAGRVLFTLEGHLGTVLSVAFSPDGKWLASSSGDYNVDGSTVKLWDLESGTLVSTLLAQLVFASSVAFSPDGRWLAAGAQGNLVKIWRMPVAAGATPAMTLSGHTGGVNAVTFAPDSTSLVSASIDRTVRLWPIPSGTQSCQLMDPAADESLSTGRITWVNEYGQVMVSVLPCGAPIPPNATCTCNCVPGRVQKPSDGCSCNQVCTCVPVYPGYRHRDHQRLRLATRFARACPFTDDR